MRLWVWNALERQANSCLMAKLGFAMKRLRITGGTMRGSLIKVEDDIMARHTASKVRESVFNMLGDIKGKKIIDFFSGSGILAFEAISRGVVHATFVDIDKKATKNIEGNIEGLHLKDMCRVLNMDVFEAISFLHKTNEVYDIFFMDPPYEKGYIEKTLKALENGIIYNMDSIFVVECSKREAWKSNLSKGWEIIKEKRYGDTVVAIINKSQSIKE